MFTCLRLLSPSVVTVTPWSRLCRVWLVAHWPFLIPPCALCSAGFPSEINEDKTQVRGGFPASFEMEQ